MKYLGIDYGEKRIGLARADEKLKIATPYKTISADSKAEKIEKLASLIKREDFSQIVVGLPLATDASENEATRQVREFVNELKQEVEAKFDFVDERFSSQEADSMGGTASRDEKSAMVILDTFLG